MPDLNAQGFADFFEALWNKPPFAWQRVLAQRVLERADAPWPEAIAMPTAAGKTACLDIAVYALAAQANRLAAGQMLTAPRRIFFVVDRRVIVDEAYDRARTLAEKLKAAPNGIVKEVANRLLELARSDTPLAVFQLRGGMYRSNAWARSPAQPAIVASTVDQLGSRLLFRAYGPGPGTWPIHAGLAGNDAIILLDEAHCAQPFLETLRAVEKYRRWGDAVLAPPFQVVVMSATPPDGMTDVFWDVSEEPRKAGHPLGDRQLAAKPTALEVVAKAKGDKALEEMAVALAKKAKQMAEQYSNTRQNIAQSDLFAGKPTGKPAVVIFCNRVATARRAWQLLYQEHGDTVALLTGRMRPIDKDDTVAGRLTELSADRSKDRELSAPMFVVATQTLEVGANLDFDVLVTECASLDALRQRFGRLNRMGRPIAGRDTEGRPLGALAAVLVRADQAVGSDDDPVYGSALAATWGWLNDRPKLDMGIVALEPRLIEDHKKLPDLNAPSNHAPVMLPSHVDCWVQTAPTPQPTPDVAAFLHGPGSRSADVQVCWRADLEADLAGDAWKEILSLCPPSSPECLPVPIGLMRRWLAGEDDARADVSDIEGELVVPIDNAKLSQRKVVYWRGGDEPGTLNTPEDLRPGDVVVIPASLGGWDVLGDLTRHTDGRPVLDWGDRAHAQARAKPLLRLNPKVMAYWPESEAIQSLRNLAHTAKTRFEEDFDELADDLRTILSDLAQEDGTPKWLKPVAAHLAKDRIIRRWISLHPGGGLIVQSKRRLSAVGGEVDLFSDETDAAASGTVHQDLHTHLDGVAEWARRFATGCGLSPPLVAAIELAASAHDLGKADPRFQSWLRGGLPFGKCAVLLAKSSDMPQSRNESVKARIRAGYPEGGRHELLSTRLLECVLNNLQPDANLRNLILHLVESHHGHCRPFAPVVFDDTAPKVTLEWNGQRLEHSGLTGLERLDSGVIERFWRLTRRYGWWGLAWLEAILRLADHRRSEWEEQHS